MSIRYGFKTLLPSLVFFFELTPHNPKFVVNLNSLLETIILWMWCSSLSFVISHIILLTDLIDSSWIHAAAKSCLLDPGHTWVVFFFLLIFIFTLLYNTVLVLPYINMNPPRVYLSSQSWTPLPPPTPYHLSGSSPCTSPKHPVSNIVLVIFKLTQRIQISLDYKRMGSNNTIQKWTKSKIVQLLWKTV